jgi:crossover junction endodeoxyribonuclease RusA
MTCQASRAISLTLPWPPSVNGYWRHIAKGPLAGRTLISEKGRAYRIAVAGHLLAQMPDAALTDRLSVHIDAFPPDLRKRDLDNIPKGLLDALTHARVWDDDSQIDRLAIERREPIAGGRVVLTIEPMPAMTPELALV